jgi:hypothetical protein
MRIKSQNGKSIAKQLKEILENSLPKVANTGLNKDLGTVHADPKGKAVLFTWKNETYRMTENLKVHKKDFTNTFVVTDECEAVEKMVNDSFKPVAPIVSVEPEKVEAKSEVTETAPTPA